MSAGKVPLKTQVELLEIALRGERQKVLTLEKDLQDATRELAEVREKFDIAKEASGELATLLEKRAGHHSQLTPEEHLALVEAGVYGGAATYKQGPGYAPTPSPSERDRRAK